MVNIDTAFTTLDQSRILGDIYINKNVVPQGNYTLKPGEYVYQNKMVYVPFLNESLNLSADNASGSWFEINNSYSDTKITEKVFMPYINHYRGFESSGYIVAYAKNKRVARKIATKNKPEVLANDSLKQVIAFDKKKYFCAFYNASGFQAKGINLSVDRPCLLMLQDGFVYVSDALHKGGLLSIIYNNKILKTELTPDGTTLTIKL